MVCRYEYYGGLSGGIADLIGRDQAVAKALMNVHWTGLQLYIAFITKAVSGQHSTVVLAQLLLSVLRMGTQTHSCKQADVCVIGK